MLSAWLTRHIVTKKLMGVMVLSVFFASFVLTDARAVVDTGEAPYKAPAPEMERFAYLDTGTFTVPAHLGEVKYTYKGASDKFIVHLQDAHCNKFAQHKISGIIDYLNKEYGIRMVNLEGGTGDYDLTIFTSITGEAIRREVADYFVKKGEINGAEFYAINNPDKVTLWGVEDKDLYLANLKVYRDSLAYKEEVDEYLKQLTHVLNNLKRHIYTPELLKIDMAYNAYKEGDMDFREYLEFLIARAKEQGVQVRQFTNLYLLEQAMELEDKIDFKKANKERTVLVDELKKGLSKDEMRELIAKSVDFKTKRISRKTFYDYLLGKASETGLNIDRFPALSNYIVYVSLYEAVDRTKVMEELDELEARIKEPLYRDDTQRRLNMLSRNLALMKNIFAITLTKTDYQYYLNSRSSFDVSNYLEFIRKEAPKYRINATLNASISKLDDYREDISRFYEYSFRRDEVFLKNLRFDRAGAVKSAVLMTGGFHTDNLCELLKKRHISYVSILPKFTSEEDYESPYFDLLAGQTTNLQRMLSSVIAKAAMMQVASMLSPALGDAVWGKANIDAFRASVLVREQIAKEKNILDVKVEGDNVVFRMEDGSEERMPVRRLLDAVHQREIDGQMERLAERQFEDIGRINVILDEIAEFLRSIGAGQGTLNRVQALKGKNTSGRALVRLARGVTFRGHAGGQGIRINAGLKENERQLKAAIIHEIIAGLYGDHFLAERAERAFLENRTGGDILARAPPLPLPVWFMTPEQRLGVDRDFAAVREPIAGEPQYKFYAVERGRGMVRDLAPDSEVLGDLLAGTDVNIVLYKKNDGTWGVILGKAGEAFHSDMESALVETMGVERADCIQGVLNNTVPTFGRKTPKEGEKGYDLIRNFEEALKKNPALTKRNFVKIEGKTTGDILFVDPLTREVFSLNSLVKEETYLEKGAEEQLHLNLINRLNKQMTDDMRLLAEGKEPVGILKEINSEMIKAGKDRLYGVDLRGEYRVTGKYRGRFEEAYGEILESLRKEPGLEPQIIDRDSPDVCNIQHGKAAKKPIYIIMTQHGDAGKFERFFMTNIPLYQKLVEYAENKGGKVVSRFYGDGELQEFAAIPVVEDDILAVSDAKVSRENRPMVGGKAAGLGDMKELLGDKVPDGFVLTWNMYKKWLDNGRRLSDGMKAGIKRFLGDVFGETFDVSVRSGAAVSMAGMMDTVLKVRNIEGVYDAVQEVFESVHGERAKDYRKREFLSDNLGTAVVIQKMVYGNPLDNPRGHDEGRFSGSGVLNGGEKEGGFTMDYVENRSGETVVAGEAYVRDLDDFKSGEKTAPLWEELEGIARMLEEYYKYPQDIEFTVENGELYILQTRDVKPKSAAAAIRILQDLAARGVITEEEAFKRASAEKDDLGTPRIIKEGEEAKEMEGMLMTTGMGATPGAVAGRIAFTPEQVSEFRKLGYPVIYVAKETSPDDVSVFVEAGAVLTTEGGPNSHAAINTRIPGNRVPCVVGARKFDFREEYDPAAGKKVKTALFLREKPGELFKAGDVLCIDGETGNVYSVARVKPGQDPKRILAGIEFYEERYIEAPDSSILELAKNALTFGDITRALDMLEGIEVPAVAAAPEEDTAVFAWGRTGEEAERVRKFFEDRIARVKEMEPEEGRILAGIPGKFIMTDTGIIFSFKKGVLHDALEKPLAEHTGKKEEEVARGYILIVRNSKGEVEIDITTQIKKSDDMAKKLSDNFQDNECLGVPLNGARIIQPTKAQFPKIFNYEPGPGRAEEDPRNPGNFLKDPKDAAGLIRQAKEESLKFVIYEDSIVFGPAEKMHEDLWIGERIPVAEGSIIPGEERIEFRPVKGAYGEPENAVDIFRENLRNNYYVGPLFDGYAIRLSRLGEAPEEIGERFAFISELRDPGRFLGGRANNAATAVARAEEIRKVMKDNFESARRGWRRTGRFIINERGFDITFDLEVYHGDLSIPGAGEDEEYAEGYIVFKPGSEVGTVDKRVLFREAWGKAGGLVTGPDLFLRYLQENDYVGEFLDGATLAVGPMDLRDLPEKFAYRRPGIEAVRAEEIKAGIEKAALIEEIREGVEETSESARSLLGKARPGEHPSVVIIELPEGQMVFDGSKYTRLSKDTDRTVVRKYGINLHMIYCVNTEEAIGEAAKKAAGIIDRVKDPESRRQSRVVAFSNRGEAADRLSAALGGLRAQNKLAGIVQGDFRPETDTERFSVVSLAVLGVGLAEWHRVKEEPRGVEIADSIKKLLMGIVDNPGAMDEYIARSCGNDVSLFVNNLLDGVFFMKIKKIDFGEIRDFMNAEAAVLEAL